MTSFCLNPLFKGPAPNSHIVWGRLHHVNRGTAFKPPMTAQHSCVHAHLHTGRGEGTPAPSATPVTRKGTVGALTRAGLLEGCRPLEEVRKWSGAQPLGQPLTFAHPQYGPSPRKRGLHSDRDAAVSMFYKSYMTFHFLLVWLGWVFPDQRPNQGPCIGSMEYQPLSHQGRPSCCC